jgi:hypothetical protein
LPLLKRARIEVYLPERGDNAYGRLHRAFEQEFLHTFGGCTVIKNNKGWYLNSDGDADFDRINVIYADTPFGFDENFNDIAAYTDLLREAALEATDEESILIAVHGIYHSI